VTASGAAVRLRHEEAGPLVHALVAHVAEGLGIRTLAIKGPVVALQGLRAPRASADVDVLVHPSELDALVAGLRAVGWRPSVTLTTPAVMPRHSENLLNDLWPVGIDLHHYFPGFLAPPGEVFDALWERHVEVFLAGRPVPACDPVGMSAIVALHLLRDDPEGTGPRLADLAARASSVLSPADVAALVSLAERTDAVATLRPFLLAVGADPAGLGPARDPEALALWERRVRFGGSLPWALHLAGTPARHWPRAVWHALLLTDEEIYAMHHVAPGEASLTRLRLRRMRRFVRGLPRAVEALAEARRHGRG
jgi:hypothetical protein